MRRFNMFVILPLLAALLSGVLTGHQYSACVVKTPPTPAHSVLFTPVPQGPGGNWSLKFSDEFNGTSVNSTSWSYQSSAESDWSSNPLGTGNLSNQQLEFDQPKNCSVTQGYLVITARPDNVTSQSGLHYNWSSCMLTSVYAFQYGYMEERAQLPSPVGFWPAFWTWQKNGYSLSGSGETDAYEFYSDNHSALYMTSHSGVGGGFTYNPLFDPSTGFHTYGLDVEPGTVTFYIDGHNVGSEPAQINGLVNILVDNFVYSQIPPQSNTTGILKVDYVRAWQH